MMNLARAHPVDMCKLILNSNDFGRLEAQDEVDEMAKQDVTAAVDEIPDDALCTICCDARIAVTLMHRDDRGHSICCRKCAEALKKQNMSCPLCRQAIVSISDFVQAKPG